MKGYLFYFQLFEKLEKKEKKDTAENKIKLQSYFCRGLYNF